MLLAAIDPYILAFSLVTVAVTVWMGFRSAKKSKTASDFFVAGRSVGVGMNASAISGEYLSAASFMGIAGMVMSSGYDALWYPVCYACGYLFLLLFIAGPLRRFGAYTIPDFAEGRFDSPVFRKIAVVFVLFIGFFYTMPQMKGAGVTLAYIFPGLPYWVGVVLVGAVITLNVALGGMKGITLVQAFQYWIKMFAIAVPIFVLMAVYGHYGKQLGVNGGNESAARVVPPGTEFKWVRQRAVGESAIDEWRLKAAAALPANSLATVDSTKIKALGLGSTLGFDKDFQKTSVLNLCQLYGTIKGKNVFVAGVKDYAEIISDVPLPHTKTVLGTDALRSAEQALAAAGFVLASENQDEVRFARTNVLVTAPTLDHRATLPAKAPADATWLNPFGPLTTKAAKTAAAAIGKKASNEVAQAEQGRGGVAVQRAPGVPPGQDSITTSSNSIANTPTRQDAGGTAERAWLAKHEKPLALLYTYSLIIAIVCGTAGLPHILVRFYTNPDGAAAKRTTMWVMILIGVFYVFPPVFGVIGRNLLPDLYNGLGAKGTDKIVLELPRLLNEKYPPLGSILSGITCAGAFAAFMSTFSGLLVSMTGALAHDVYGRILRPKSTPEQRMRMFKIGAVLIGGVAIVLGSFVEPLEINFMVGQAFAIAAASYFPLLFMAVWWRKLTMKGAAVGMLVGGVCALVAAALTNFSNLALDKGPMGKLFSGFAPLNDFWAAHPLLRILCEQPAIWAVPLAIILMIVVSKLTAHTIPTDSRMKMLVLHAPEQLGLKQEYIQEHQAGPGH